MKTIFAALALTALIGSVGTARTLRSCEVDTGVGCVVAPEAPVAH